MLSGLPQAPPQSYTGHRDPRTGGDHHMSGPGAGGTNDQRAQQERAANDARQALEQHGAFTGVSPHGRRQQRRKLLLDVESGSSLLL